VKPPHPIFLGLIAVTALGGWLAWEDRVDDRLAVVLFVAGGWLVSLCLHEFGHAVVALWGGDRSVVAKGYLTLNPLRYTEVGLSLVLPLLFLLMGGLGLPGGAVWVNRGAIRSRGMRSLTALAGPAMSALVGLVVAAPFLLGWPTLPEHPTFASALALLALLQVTAVLINLLPVPGLDGFAALEPFLSRRTLQRLGPVRQWGWLVLFVLLFWTPRGSEFFWDTAGRALDALDVSRAAAVAGLRSFQFWVR
jgi:Zn-dependent protease